MAVIYVIKNEKNGKMYVGATTTSIKKRWRYHCNDINDKRCRDRKLYSALREYGKENFSISKIETVRDDKRYEREKYWIKELDTYRNGYNETLGGKGKAKLDDIAIEKIINTYRRVGNMKDTSEDTGFDIATIKKTLIKNGERVKTTRETMINRTGVPVDMLSINGELMQSFDSISSAAKFLVESGYARGSYSWVCRHIKDVCEGRNYRKSVAKHKWRYAEKEVRFGVTQ